MTAQAATRSPLRFDYSPDVAARFDTRLSKVEQDAVISYFVMIIFGMQPGEQAVFAALTSAFVLSARRPDYTATVLRALAPNSDFRFVIENTGVACSRWVLQRSTVSAPARRLRKRAKA